MIKVRCMRENPCLIEDETRSEADPLSPGPNYSSIVTIREASLVRWRLGLQRPGRTGGRSDQLPGYFLERIREEPPDPDTGRIGKQRDNDSRHFSPVVLAQVGRTGNGFPVRMGVIDRHDFSALLTQQYNGLKQ